MIPMGQYVSTTPAQLQYFFILDICGIADG